MTSTVTTSTATTMTSLVPTAGLGASLALVAILLFLAFVIQRELVSVSSSKRSILARGLNIGLVPLGFVFAMIAGYRLMHLFR